MMYGYAFGAGWMWFLGIVLLLVLVALTALIIIVSVGGARERSARPHGAASSARQIAEERLARGEITPDEFRQIAGALDERD